MPFCPNCGTQATGAYCPNCGSPISGTGTTGSSSGYSTGPQAGGLSIGVASALCYLLGLITGIIFLVIAPYNQNKTVRFHAFQSIFWTIAMWVIWFALGLFSLVTHGAVLLLYPLVGIAFFCIWLYMMYTAYNNRMVKLPIVGDLAAKQA